MAHHLNFENISHIMLEEVVLSIKHVQVRFSSQIDSLNGHRPYISNFLRHSGRISEVSSNVLLLYVQNDGKRKLQNIPVKCL